MAGGPRAEVEPVHTYVIVQARPGRTVPAHVASLLAADRCSHVTFAPDDHVHWSSAAGDLHFAGWQAGGTELGVGSRWSVDDAGVTAFSGHLWRDTQPWAEGRSWADQLATGLDPVHAAEVARRLDGVFTLAVLDRHGHGCVTADPLGVGLVYRAENDDLTVLSNRAALAAHVAAPSGRAPARDLEGVGWLAYSNNLQDDRTTFEGVRTIPQASSIRLAPGRAPETRTWSDAPWRSDDGAGTDAAIAHLRALTRTLASLPSSRGVLELTGGRDSRMILALLLAEGLAHDLTYVTWGPASLPDVVVASALADRFGLDLEAAGRPRRPATRDRGVGRPGTDPARRAGAAVPPAARPPGAIAADPQAELTLEQRLRRHLWRTSGGTSLWDLSKHGRDPSPRFVLTGQFGELLRTNYPRTTALPSWDLLPAYVRSGAIGFDGAGLLRRDVRAHYDALVLDRLAALGAPGGTVHDAIDAYNQVARLRRWFGTLHELDNRNRLFPLYSMPATRAGFAMGAQRRRDEELPLAIMAATCPELAAMPFSGSAWPTTLVARHPELPGLPSSPLDPPWRPPRRPRWLPRRRRRSPRAPATAVEAGHRRDAQQQIPVLRAFLDLGPDHRLYEVLDHDRTMRAVSELDRLDFLARRAVYDAVTAAGWLGGAEVAEDLVP